MPNPIKQQKIKSFDEHWLNKTNFIASSLKNIKRTVQESIANALDHLNEPKRPDMQTIMPSQETIILFDLNRRIAEKYNIRPMIKFFDAYRELSVSIGGVGREQNVQIATANMQALTERDTQGILDFFKGQKQKPEQLP